MIDYRKEFLKCLGSIDQSKRRYDIFKDFLELSTISFSGVFNKNDEDENRYKDIIQQYKYPEKIAELLHITVMALTQKTHDFLGEIYMFGEFGNKGTGQFFTPFHISEFMADITLYETDLKSKIEENGFITISDPCCGSGVMFLAASEVIIKLGYNPQQVMKVCGIDIDPICCYMSFIQTNLLGLSAQINYGNSITMDIWRTFTTPMTYINYCRFGFQKPKQDENLINQKRIEIKKDIEVLEKSKNSDKTIKERTKNEQQTKPQQLSLFIE